MLVPVHDPADDRLADYVSLTDVALRSRSEPERGLFVAESAEVLRRAVGAGCRPRSFLLDEIRVAELDDVLALFPEVPVYVGGQDLLRAVTGYRVHRGVLAAMQRPVPVPVAALVGALPAGPARVVVLEDLVDHTNVGAVFRSVAALGADAVVVAPRCADPLYRRSVRVSMGTVFAVPWAHIGGPDWLVYMLSWGLRTVVMEAFVPTDAVALMRRHGATTTGGATALYQSLLALQREQPDEPLVPTLRFLTGGGGPKPPELFAEVQREMFGVRICHGYGMTECPMIANGGPGDTDAQLMHTEGAPVRGCQVRIVRDDGTDAAPGEEGEIRLRGDMLFRGYLDPAQTAEVMDADGWFVSGDRGVLHADGHLSVTGRTKDVIIRKGENIGAVEVESVVYEHPSVAAVAVIGLPDAERGERVCAVVELVEGSPPLTLTDLQDHCRAAGLSQRKWPEQLEIVEAMPRNPTMKILKYRLKEQLS